jgi:septal ring factor EnvC (AmiA/AmiB activator)
MPTGDQMNVPMALPAPAQEELNDHVAQQLEVLRKTVNGNIETLKHLQDKIQALETDKKDMQQQVSELQYDTPQSQGRTHESRESTH